MSKSILKISSLLMACLVLFSTLSFTVEKHICDGKVADVALFGDLERCDMPVKNYNDNILSFAKESCCQDEVHFLQGANAELKISQKLQVQVQVFAVLFTNTYLNLFDSTAKDSKKNLSYSPPIVVKNIQVLHDTFLI